MDKTSQIGRNSNKKKKGNSRFAIKDVIIIPLCAALGIGSKQVIIPALSFFTKQINIPGGSIYGGLYMLWLVLARELTGKNGSGTLTAIVQSFMILIMPHGSHGIFSFITYSAPGIAVDVIAFLFQKFSNPGYVSYYFEGAAANFIGTLLVNIIVFDLPYLVFTIVIFVALFSGGIGGLIARGIVIEYEKLSKVQILTHDKDKRWYDLHLDEKGEFKENIS